MTERNARFWIYNWDGESYVKLTLKPGESISVTYGGATEEGYDVTSRTYTHEGDCVSLESYRDARDCDGRLTSASVLVCPLDRLDPSDPTGPRWEEDYSWQRDHAAEAAGY